MTSERATDREQAAMRLVGWLVAYLAYWTRTMPPEAAEQLDAELTRFGDEWSRLASAPAGEREADSGFVVLNPRGDVDFRAKLRMTPDGAWGDIGSRWGSRSNATKASMIEEFEAEGYRVVPARLLIEAPSPGAAREESPE